MPRPFRVVALALLACVPAVPLAAQVRPGSKEAADVVPDAKVKGVDITYLANEGFLLQSGRYSILIDAFLREPTGMYGALPTEAYKELVQAKPPFDGLTLVFVSHDHADHVQYRGLEKFLGNNARAQLITSQQVIARLKESAQDFPAIQARVTPVRTRPGTPEVLMQEEVRISFLPLKHAGKANDEIVNLAHLIQIGGMKILHLGDAEPSPENFAPYGLQREQLDVVFIPYWYFGSEAGRRIIAQDVPARIQIACHVPPQEQEKLEALLKEQFPDVILFKEALEKRSFQPAEAAPGEAR